MGKIIKNSVKTIFLLLVCVFTQQSFAQQNYLDNFYWGIGFNNINTSVENAGGKLEVDSNVYSFTIGKELHPNFDVEIKYGVGTGYDTFNNPVLEFEISSILQTSLIIKQQFNNYFQGFVKLGHASIEENGRVVATGVVDNEERNDFTYGIGARINIDDSSAIRFEYENLHSESKVNSGGDFEFAGYGISYERKF